MTESQARGQGRSRGGREKRTVRRIERNDVRERGGDKPAMVSIWDETLRVWTQRSCVRAWFFFLYRQKLTIDRSLVYRDVREERLSMNLSLEC